MYTEYHREGKIPDNRGRRPSVSFYGLIRHLTGEEVFLPYVPEELIEEVAEELSKELKRLRESGELKLGKKPPVS